MLLFFYTKTIKHKKVKKKRDLAHKFEHCYLQYKGLCRILKSLKTSAIFKQPTSILLSEQCPSGALFLPYFQPKHKKVRSKNTGFSDRTLKMNAKRKNYSNIAEIDSSLLIRRIASASIVERVSTRTLPSAFISGESGTVSVTTISSMASLAKCCAAAPEKTA